MSSAILYLAIVAIWAFLLVPRWIRRPQTASFVADNGGDGELSTAEPGTGELGANEAGAEFAGLSGRDDSAATEDAAPRPGIVRSSGLIASRRAAERWQDETDFEHAEPVTEQPDARTAAPPGRETVSSGADSAAPMPSGPLSAGPGPVVTARPPISRSKILQARRRLLTTLVLLAVAAVTCTTLRLTSWWVCVPPAGMLGMYMLLLREAAVADDERARLRAAEAGAARQRARARSRAAWAARTPQPTAEIIDISARLGDQLYDQYADATVRAVGD